MITVPGTAGRLAQLYSLRAEPLYGAAGAPVYDVVSGQDREEIGDVLRLAQGLSAPILELACGSGRLTLPLIARGHQVVALDNSPALLELLARRRPGGRGRVRLVEGDMTAFDLGQSFPLIVLGTSSVCLLDARQRADTFRRVRDHLSEDGVFFVSTMDFADSLLPRVRPVERTALAVVDDSALTLVQHFDGRRRVRTTSLLHETVHNGQSGPRSLFVSEVNILGSTQLEAELADAGLTVTERRRGPGGEQTPVQFVCRPTGGRR